MSEASSRLSELKKKLLSKAAKPAPSATTETVPVALPQPTIRPLVKVVAEEADAIPKKQPLTLRSLMGNRKKSSESSSAPPSGSRLKEAPAHRAAMLEESKSNIIKSKLISLNKPTSVADKIAHFEQNPPASLTGGTTPLSLASLIPQQQTMVNPFAGLTKPVESQSIFPIFSKPQSPFAALLKPPQPEEEVNPFATAPPPVAETVAIIAAQLPHNREELSKFIQTQRGWLKRRVRETNLAYNNNKKIKWSDIDISSFIGEHKRFLDALVAIK
jgi:hypothetical protein